MPLRNPSKSAEMTILGMYTPDPVHTVLTDVRDAGREVHLLRVLGGILCRVGTPPGGYRDPSQDPREDSSPRYDSSVGAQGGLIASLCCP